MALLGREPSPEAAIAFMDELEHFLSYLAPTERKIIELRLLGYGNRDIADQLDLKCDRQIRRLVERVRAVAEQVGLGDQRLRRRFFEGWRGRVGLLAGTGTDDSG
jgi:hypothetical protein